jgi:hypothetical protein
MAKLAFHQATLREIPKERVVSSRCRSNRRGAKCKMSKFQIRTRTSRSPYRGKIEYIVRIRK